MTKSMLGYILISRKSFLDAHPQTPQHDSNQATRARSNHEIKIVTWEQRGNWVLDRLRGRASFGVFFQYTDLLHEHLKHEEACIAPNSTSI